MSAGDYLLRPAALPLLLAAPLVAAAFWIALRLRTLRLAEIAGPRVRALAPEAAESRMWLRPVLFGGGLLLALLALLEPVGAESASDVEQRGVDLVVCLDVSRSMLAQDVAPSRLERAQREIRALAGRARGDRLALVVFAGEARLAVPLTRDGKSFAELTDQADATSVLRGGTDLGGALETALEALSGRTGEHEAILVVTDGEDPEGRGLRAAETCRDRGIAVHCLGLGSPRGAKIPADLGGGPAFLRDREGREVVSAMDAAALRRIAETTGGVFVDAAAGPSPLVAVYEERVLPLSRRAFAAERRRERAPLFQLPLACALVLWTIGVVAEGRRNA